MAPLLLHPRQTTEAFHRPLPRPGPANSIYPPTGIPALCHNAMSRTDDCPLEWTGPLAVLPCGPLLDLRSGTASRLAIGGRFECTRRAASAEPYLSYPKAKKYLGAYIGEAGIGKDEAPLFQSPRGRTGILTGRRLAGQRLPHGVLHTVSFTRCPSHDRA